MPRHVAPVLAIRRQLALLGCLVAVSTVSAQVAPASPAPGAATAEGDIVKLSPFEVTSALDRGYQATATMSGTRLNSKLEDLAASISVVTKQQLSTTCSSTRRTPRAFTSSPASTSIAA